MAEAALPAIVGLAGPALASAEAALFRRTRPAGVILFGRNVVDPAQLARLVADLREVLPGEAVLMVDQEGGRVARLRPPHWQAHPPAASIGATHARDPAAGLRAAFATGLAIGRQSREAGFDVVAAPVLDLAIAGADPVIGDRSFSHDPDAVAALGRAMAGGLLAAGIQPVGKHAPGHGRAKADSHVALPVLDDLDPADIAPFRALAARLPWLMTAHVLYRAADPERPATVSPLIIAQVIRGAIGFDGVLVSDDLSMAALAGTPAERGAAAIAAGCDLSLYGAGLFAETAALLDILPPLTERARARLARGASMAAASVLAA